MERNTRGLISEKLKIYFSIYVGTSNLLVKSENKGSSWEVLSNSFHRSDIKGIAIHPNNPSIIYVRSVQGECIYI